MNPTVSVIVRSMDRPVLARALASVAAQQAPGVSAEVLVVAACGPSHRPVQASLAPGIEGRLVGTGRRLTRPQAGNAGLEAARGRFITFLDDDDELLPHQFATLIARLSARPEVDFAHARSIAVDSSGKPLYLYGGPWIAWRQLSHGFFQLAGVMFRRDLLSRGVRFDERLEILEDLEFFVQCARVARFGYVGEPVSRYYVMDGSSGTGEGSNRDQARIRAALDYISHKWRDLARELADLTPARLERARSELDAGRFEDALGALRPVLEREPDDLNALNLAGVAHLNLGQLDEASRLLSRAAAQAPSHPGLRANIELVERKRRERLEK